MKDNDLLSDLAKLIKDNHLDKDCREPPDDVCNVEDYISTGSFILDDLLGGGFKVPSLVEIYGPESSGKTVLSLHFLRSAQQAGRVGAYLDLEHAITPAYCSRMGINIEELLVVRPEHGEEALDATEQLAKECQVIVIDSLAAMTPKKILQGGQMSIAGTSAYYNQAVNRFKTAAVSSRCLVVLLNQIRHRPTGGLYSFGGRMLEYTCDVIIRLEKDCLRQTSYDEPSGFWTAATVVKNRYGLQIRDYTLHTSGNIPFNHKGGIDHMEERIELAVKFGKEIEEDNRYYLYNGIPMGHGMEAAKRWLACNPDAIEKIDSMLAEKIYNRG